METKVDKRILKDLADRLITTLGSMDSEKADAIVRDVATSLYNDVLKEKGYIKRSNSMYLCTSRGGYSLSEYKWSSLDTEPVDK
mgnify:CR=1 FL=1